MTDISAEDMEIFDQATALDKAWRNSEQEWLTEVKKSEQGTILYEDTKPFFDKYITDQLKWKEFIDKHGHIFYAEKK